MPDSLKRLQPYVERALKCWLPPENKGDDLVRAMHYSVLGGGKRLRPILALLACQAVSGNVEPALPAGCAVEMIHAYSLIHDDLPCMDDDDLRRGRPTTHKVFGEAMAVLAGDALQTLAFAILTDPKNGYRNEQSLAMARELARAAGYRGMVGGQAKDIGKTAHDLDTLARLHREKTGAIFKAAVTLGAIAAGASDRERKALAGYAEAFGLAFQIMDDVLDVVGDPAKMGRYKGSDEAAGRATYPGMIGVEASRRRAQQSVEQGRDALMSLSQPAAELDELLTFVLTRDT